MLHLQDVSYLRVDGPERAVGLRVVGVDAQVQGTEAPGAVAAVILAVVVVVVDIVVVVVVVVDVAAVPGQLRSSRRYRFQSVARRVQSASDVIVVGIEI